eukprot:sb/3478290/
MKLRSIKAADPPLSLTEARVILAETVLAMKEEGTQHPNALRTCKRAASKYIKEQKMAKTQVSQGEEPRPKKEPPKVIIAPLSSDPGPCPCKSCIGKHHDIPG